MTKSLTSRLVKGSSTILLFSFLSSPLAYLTRMIFSRSMSTEHYGLFYAVLGFFSILATFNDLGFGYSVAYLIPKYLVKKDLRTCWKLYKYDQFIELITSVSISLVLFLFADELARYYFKVPEAKTLIYIFIIYFITNSFVSALQKFFTGLQKEVYYASQDFLRSAYTFVISFLLFYFDFGNVLTYAIGWSSAYIFLSIVYFYLIKKNFSHFIEKITWDPPLFKRMFNYAIPSLLNNSIFLLINYTDTIYLTLFRNVQSVGALNVIVPIITIPSIFLSPINSLFFPMVSDLVEVDRPKVKLLIENLLKVVPFISFYFVLFIFIFPTVSVATLFGYKWAEMIEMPLRIFALGYLFSALSSFLNTVAGGLGLVKERLKISLAVAALNIILGATLTYFYGLLGLVLANLVVYSVSLILTIKLVRIEIKFEIPYFYYIKLLSIAFLLIGMVNLFNINPTTFSAFIVSGIIYSVFMAFFSVLIGVIDVKTYRVFYEMSRNMILKYYRK